MKRKVASRRLKRRCIQCNKSFVKGDVHYIDRKVFVDYGEVIGYENVYCARCKYENGKQSKRYKKFVESGNCEHPLVEEVWVTMAGEGYVKEPSHDECLVCGKRV